ncbi:unnamed protein product [Moneuplotes crassus]|uniref:Uncharacterized protein n=1 Tax=Euplotes crassus TaxID=5936 RepID=A0AAD1X7L1_EUPCR|nr:unnamed protein product [Moneuplotes crassus]
MNNSIYNQLDENLSEDILSEGSSTCQVKVSKRLGINMDMTPFNPSRFGSKLKDHSDNVCAPKTLKAQGILGAPKKNYYFTKHKSLLQKFHIWSCNVKKIRQDSALCILGRCLSETKSGLCFTSRLSSGTEACLCKPRKQGKLQSLYRRLKKKFDEKAN